MDINKVIELREKYSIKNVREDLLIEKILKDEYEYDYAIIPLGILFKNVTAILENRYIDMFIQMPSFFCNTNINFILVHFSNNKPNNLLTGIFEGEIYENIKKEKDYKTSSFKKINGDITEDFQAFLNDINNYLQNKKIVRNDLNTFEYSMFSKNNLNPLYYTKQAINIRKELENSDYKYLYELVDIITIPNEKNIIATYIDSKNFTYPLKYKDLKKTKINRAIKVEKGDIIGLLVGKEPKFYLYNENFENVYIKAGNYCILRCKNEKYRAYMVNYLNDEKARYYFSSTVHGVCIPILTKSDLKDLKIILPTEDMLKIADESQAYIMNQKMLTTYEINELIRESYKIQYTKESQKMISDDIINMISSMKIKVLKELINDDLNEVDVCFKNGAYKSAIILCGSILEAVLLDWLSEYENTTDISNLAIGEDGRDLELSKIIYKLKNIIKPYWYEANKAHEIRKTRNMVHPKECIKNNKKVTKIECEKIINDLMDILESKERKHM